ncbi:predicted protein [Nematostella vectensis]|uniref:SIPAR domain-containing protein n=1 Tax=Nematostella vectensis TaxID=45351 RepID=A7SET1_NEMVE|nr:predicted protein [Nematostella vectensis]|eukprot:XP_001629822.1 predicted protein [Nematostella vectensis]
MSRSVRDLRELICISRLSYHGEEEQDPEPENLNAASEDFNGNRVPKDTKTKRKSPKKKVKDKAISGLESHKSPRLSPGGSSKAVILPPIRNSSAGSSGSSSGRNSPASSLTNEELQPCRPFSSIAKKYQPRKTNFDDVLVYMDATVIAEWLSRANKSVQSLTSWLHSGCNFVHFAHFWLSDLVDSKRRDAIDMEFSIVMDEVQFAFGVGLQGKEISMEDIRSLTTAIFWEYPGKLSDTENQHYFLTMLICLCSGRQDNYKSLLSNVRCSTNNKQFAQLVLATRSFTIVSICSGVIEFFKQVSPVNLTHCDITSAPHAQDLISVAKLFAFQAVEKGFLDVFKFLVEEYQLDPVLTIDSSDKTFLFTSVISGQEQVLNYLLSLEPRPNVNKVVSASGNTPLHAAVNCGNQSMVKLLANAGADLNAANEDCNGATPLFLAIMSGNLAMVSLLLSLGCRTNVYMGALAVSPLDLAKELELHDIAEMLDSSHITE